MDTKNNDFAEYTDVYLTHPVIHRGVTLPAGTRGSVIEKYPNGTGYLVEFEQPTFMVVFLPGGSLRSTA
jgi:hypothetical protein